MSRESVIAAFEERSSKLGGLPIHVHDQPTEEMVETLQKGQPVKMYARMVKRAAQVASRAIARLEENYLYSSRRFPVASNNTIGAGALAIGRFPFFTAQANGEGVGLGFPTGFQLTLAETNMEMAGQIPQGQSFVFNQLGVSFNSEAAVHDINQLMDAATLEFSKSGGQFQLNHGPVKMWPGGMGNGGQFGTMTAAATNQFGTNGVPDIRAVRNLKIARVLKTNDVFSYAFNIHRVTRSTDGTAFALGNFVVATIWLWGGWKSAIAA